MWTGSGVSLSHTLFLILNGYLVWTEIRFFSQFFSHLCKLSPPPPSTSCVYMFVCVCVCVCVCACVCVCVVHNRGRSARTSQQQNEK